MPKILDQLSKIEGQVVMSIDREEYYKYAPLADEFDNLTLLIRKGKWYEIDGECIWIHNSELTYWTKLVMASHMCGRRK